jgi:hypothetical protein
MTFTNLAEGVAETLGIFQRALKAGWIKPEG